MVKNHSKIAIVIGTKAEFIKCMPLMLELQRQKKDYWFMHTGQHSLKDSCEEFGIKKPDFVLSPVPKGNNTKFWSRINKSSIFWLFSMVFKIKKSINGIKPRYVIYHGDTMSTAAAAIGSSKLLNPGKKWKNVHLEAGLRSGSWFEPFPEEISRQLSDGFSDILLAVSDLSEKNLKKEGKKGVVKIGNTIIDSAEIAYDKAKKAGYKKPKRKYALINIHRHENLRSKGRMKRIVKIIKGIKANAIWPLHDNTRRYLEVYGLMEEIKGMKNINLTNLVSYQEFIFLLANCKYLVCDGGSIQEESLIFKKPCLILRKRTERQEGLSTGINFMTLDVNKGKKIVEKMERGINAKRFNNPYGNKGLSKRILGVLR